MIRTRHAALKVSHDSSEIREKGISAIMPAGRDQMSLGALDDGPMDFTEELAPTQARETPPVDSVDRSGAGIDENHAAAHCRPHSLLSELNSSRYGGRCPPLETVRDGERAERGRQT
jgi:hypothetical protein